MTVSRKEWVKPNVKEKNIWQAQARKEMEWWVDSRSASMHGMMAKVWRISEMDRVHRKRYMGVWSLHSLKMVAMMSRLPSSVNRYISRNSRKNIS
jgi:hypothetical protein